VRSCSSIEGEDFEDIPNCKIPEDYKNEDVEEEEKEEEK